MRLPSRLRALVPWCALFALSLARPAHATAPPEALPTVEDEPAPPAADDTAGPEPGPAPAAASSKSKPASNKSSAKKKSAKKKSSKKKKSTKKSRKPRPPKSKLCAYRTPLHHHVVEQGEHLGLIAGRYGVLRKDLIALNPELKNPSLIRPGDKLKVCPEIAPRTSVRKVHVVEKGESLGLIAKAYGLTTSELLEQQEPKIDDPNRILPGDELLVSTQGEIIAGFEPEVHRKYDRGSLRTSHKLHEGMGYRIKRPNLAYGTSNTIKLIADVIDRYHRRADGGPAIRVGDISKKGGGPLKGHVSHQRGVDVDVGLVHKGPKKDELRFTGATKKNLDVRRTWILVHEFLRTGEVRYIFLDYRLQKLLYEYAKDHGVSQSKLDEYFQYPRGIGRNHGIVRHWKGHRNHIHVRFRR